ncbi:MAG TPA: hypothetical protein VHY30_11295 [Verrucomicrobiae bacterium]|jgi:hypothetical protein|nr:hypothetical protein [Verrucomicrobiae bacterium]
MKTSHARALQSFARDLQWLLALRLGVQLATAWFFAWGVVVLALRIFGTQNTFWLALGLFGIVPLIFISVMRARRLKPEFSKIRANYDRLNACGGVVMSEEAADMGAWLAQLPEAAAPKLHWHSGRAMLLLSVSAIFAGTTLLLPERLTRFSIHHPLEIGQIVSQLQAEVKTLAQEKILPDKKADDLQKQLSQLQKDSFGYDPNKTWEALDHIKQSNSDAAKQAAEEALKKTESLTQAETLAKAMQQAADTGMNEATASQAAQDLASMLNAAKLEDGILNAQIPPELLAGLNGLNKEQMQKLLQALELNKNSLGLTASNLANLKMIDPATLAKLLSAGKCDNSGALADYLSTCTNGGDLVLSWLLHPGKGGPGGGGPEADMTWNDGASEKDLKFQQHALPPSSHLDDAQLVGVSKAAPELSGNDVSAQHGALDNATASGGSAHAQIILPEQRQAVQNFFKRDEK